MIQQVQHDFQTLGAALYLRGGKETCERRRGVLQRGAV